MRLAHVKITGFRSLQDYEMPFDGLTVLIGKNNSGKSALVAALRLLFGDKDCACAENDFCHLGEPAEEIVIEARFTLSDGEGSGPLPEKALLVDANGRHYAVVTKRYNKDALKGSTRAHKMDGATVVPEGLDVAANTKLGNLIYIPPVRELSAELKTTNTALLGKLLASIVNTAVEDSDAYKRVREAAGDLIDELRQPSSGDNLATLGDIEGALSEEIAAWGYKASVRVGPPGIKDLITQNLSVYFQDAAGASTPDRLGSGLQRSIIAALIKVWSRASAQKGAGGKSDQGDIPTLLCYEEPEAMLHVTQVRRLFSDLVRIADSDNSQVVVTTHSAELANLDLDGSGYGRVVRLDKGDGGTLAFALSEETLAEIRDDTPKDFMPIVWLNPDRNNALFAERAVLVEGETDSLVVRYILDKAKDRRDIHVINCGQKSNIPFFMRYCRDFGIKHVVIHDQDSPEDADQVEWNADIKKAHNDFTERVLPLEDELEGYLGVKEIAVPGVKKRRNKVPKMLYYLREGRVDPEKLAALTEFVLS